jgi:hypothetical protein
MLWDFFDAVGLLKKSHNFCPDFIIFEVPEACPAVFTFEVPHDVGQIYWTFSSDIWTTP